MVCTLRTCVPVPFSLLEFAKAVPGMCMRYVMLECRSDKEGMMPPNLNHSRHHQSPLRHPPLPKNPTKKHASCFYFVQPGIECTSCCILLKKKTCVCAPPVSKPHSRVMAHTGRDGTIFHGRPTTTRDIPVRFCKIVPKRLNYDRALVRAERPGFLNAEKSPSES